MSQARSNPNYMKLLKALRYRGVKSPGIVATTLQSKMDMSDDEVLLTKFMYAKHPCLPKTKNDPGTAFVQELHDQLCKLGFLVRTRNPNPDKSEHSMFSTGPALMPYLEDSKDAYRGKGVPEEWGGCD